MAGKIEAVVAREVLDSRGNPTVEAEVLLAGGIRARGLAPSGASTGKHEAVELRDGDPARFLGKGVLKAAKNAAGELGAAVKGLDAADQEAVDRRMIDADGTADKSRLGANAILAVSIACAHAAARLRGVPLYRSLEDGAGGGMPVPFMNVINGGAHAPNGLDIQEFMLVPHGFATFAEALRAGAEIYHHLGRLLADRGLAVAVGDEGGYAPELERTQDALHALEEAVTKAGYEMGTQVSLALDCAATEYWNGEGYALREAGGTLSSDEAIEWLAQLCGRCPHLASIEDGLAEDDWRGWSALTRRLGAERLLVGDDIFVTNPRLLERGISGRAANAVLVKPNQVGTITETRAVVRMAREAGYAAILSHRSGETEDTTVADLSVALGAGKIKAGAPCRTDRTAKYNRLLRIAEESGRPLAKLRG